MGRLQRRLLWGLKQVLGTNLIPLRNQLWHTDEAGASLTCYQSTLISGTSFFSQWYFPSSGRSTNEILWEIVASSPFLCPSRLRRSLARSRETRFTRPNRRACSRSNLMTLALPKISSIFFSVFEKTSICPTLSQFWIEGGPGHSLLFCFKIQIFVIKDSKCYLNKRLSSDITSSSVALSYLTLLCLN